MDYEQFLQGYIGDLNAAVKSREFPPLVMKWFASDGVFHVRNEEDGIEQCKKLWKHLLPTGAGPGGEGPREVIQKPYKVENGRVYSWRSVQAGGAPKPMYGVQETQFDDRTLISEIFIQSVGDKPEVDEDPNAEKSRLGRIFLEFADAFNDFFATGDPEILAEWCTDDVHMLTDSSFQGMAVIGPHNRINEGAEFTLEGFEEIEDNKLKADISFVNWGGIPKGRAPWEITVEPEEEKIKRLYVELEI